MIYVSGAVLVCELLACLAMSQAARRPPPCWAHKMTWAQRTGECVQGVQNVMDEEACVGRGAEMGWERALG